MTLNIPPSHSFYINQTIESLLFVNRTWVVCCIGTDVSSLQECRDVMRLVVDSWGTCSSEVLKLVLTLTSPGVRILVSQRGCFAAAGVYKLALTVTSESDVVILVVFFINYASSNTSFHLIFSVFIYSY